MDQSAIVKEFEDADAIINGHFILSSGRHSGTYLQCARVMMDTHRAARLCRALVGKIYESDIGKIDLVVAPAMGGVIVGYELARHLDVPTIFCERQDGVFAIRRGFSFPEGTKILMVEDVVTTGKSFLEAIECVNKHGGEVIGEACLVNRSGKENPLPIPLVYLMELNAPTYSPETVPEHLKRIPPEKPGSRWLK